MNRAAGAAFAVAISAVLVPATQAATVTWTQWSPTYTANSTTGAGSGSAGSVGVTYSGELENIFFDQPSWGPASTFTGGSVGNAPTTAEGIIQLQGGRPTVNTITFSHAVTNPIIAIWSLGGNGPAEFDFSTSNFTVESGGPSAEYGGSALNVLGNVVSGLESNGTLQFNGTFTSISWTNPTFENWYGFTVGVGGVPEPATWAMMLLGFGCLGVGLRLRRGESRAAA